MQNSIRLRVFFDIDGTLLVTDGAGRAALCAALESVYGTSGELADYTFHGKTDPQIVLELMGAAGLEEGEIRRRMPSVWPVYLAALARELEMRRAAGRIRLLPGVAELLAALESRQGVLLGLLTGNIESGARLKLEAAGVAARFGLGGFGSDSELRTEIARIAVARSRSASGTRNGPLSHVVVGDTPEDVACARAAEAHAVAVATGRHGLAELKGAGADAVFEDLRDTGRVLACIYALAGADGTFAGDSDGR